MRRVNKRIVTAALSVSLLAGACQSGNPETLDTSNVHEIVYDATPERNHSAGDCEGSTNSWASYIDGQPDESKNPNRMHTIGLVEDWSEDGKPVFAAGVAILGLGNETYRIRTSNSEEGFTVDLNEGTYAEVLDVTDDYSAVFSARLDDTGGRAYFKLNCLPDFEYSPGSGDPGPVPLDDLIPIVPENITENPTDQILDA